MICFKCPANVQTFSGERNKTLLKGTNARKATRTLTCLGMRGGLRSQHQMTLDKCFPHQSWRPTSQDKKAETPQISSRNTDMSSKFIKYFSHVSGSEGDLDKHWSRPQVENEITLEVIGSLRTNEITFQYHKYFGDILLPK